MSSHTRSAAVIALVLLVALAGCGGAGGGGEDGAAGGGGGAGSGDGGTAGAGGGAATASGGGAASLDSSAASAEATAAGPAAEGGQAGDAQALQARRALIKTGHVRLEVPNVRATRENLTAATRRLGGYVGASSVQTRSENGANVTTGRLVLRVPSRNFSTLYTRVRDAGTVLSARTNTTDVTEQLVDLEARLENLQIQRQRLRDLYANASDTEAVLAVQERLSNVQSKIEQLKAQLQSLRGRIAYSTITVRLVEPAPIPTAEAWYAVGAIDAFLSSIGGVATTLRAAVVGFAYLAPYLLVFGVPLVLGYLVYRQRSTSTSPE